MGVYEKSLRVPIFFFFSLVHKEPWGLLDLHHQLTFFLFSFFLCMKLVWQRLLPWHSIFISNGIIHIGQGFFLLDFEPKFVHHSKLILGKLMGLEKSTP
jgi:hypothetical protein